MCTIIISLYFYHYTKIKNPIFFSLNLMVFQHCLKYYSSSHPEKPNFIMRVFNNIKDEIAKNKEMKQNLEQFRAEKKKLEESDNLIKAR